MDIQEIIKQKFTSSNSIPVDLIRITREEYDQLIESVANSAKNKIKGKLIETVRNITTGNCGIHVIDIDAFLKFQNIIIKGIKNI